jgi:hypothetical protein
MIKSSLGCMASCHEALGTWAGQHNKGDFDLNRGGSAIALQKRTRLFASRLA